MKNKTIVSLALSGVLLVSGSAMAAIDIKDHWAQRQIEFLLGREILSGYPDETFKPERKISREEAAQVLSNYLGERESGAGVKAPTDSQGRWSTQAIENLLGHGVIRGYEDGTFRPLKSITRAEFATMVYNLLEKEDKLIETKSTSLKDIEGSWAEKYIQTLANMGVLNGYGDGTFKPNNNITRAEAANVIAVVVKYIENPYFLENGFDGMNKNEAILQFISDNYVKDLDKGSLDGKDIDDIFSTLEDPYSGYMDVKSFQNYKSLLKGEFIGIGVQLFANEDDRVEVLSVVPKSPADRAGISSGDIIDSIDGVYYPGEKVYELTQSLNGTVGSQLNVGISRESADGTEQKKDLTLIREKIRLTTVFGKMLEGEVGYIKIATFETKTYDDFKLALEDLRSQGMKGLVVDLRFNSGGSLDAAIDIADELVGQGTIIHIKDKNGNTQNKESDARNLGLPLAVIVNEQSASSSEILAAAVKENDAGTLVGHNTFGKGSIQTVVELSDGTGFKLTVAEYFSPNGNRIEQQGVSPDLEVSLPLEIENIGPDNIAADSQLRKALEIVIEDIQ